MLEAAGDVGVVEAVVGEQFGEVLGAVEGEGFGGVGIEIVCVDAGVITEGAEAAETETGRIDASAAEVGLGATAGVVAELGLRVPRARALQALERAAFVEQEGLVGRGGQGAGAAVGGGEGGVLLHAAAQGGGGVAADEHGAGVGVEQAGGVAVGDVGILGVVALDAEVLVVAGAADAPGLPQAGKGEGLAGQGEVDRVVFFCGVLHGEQAAEVDLGGGQAQRVGLGGRREALDGGVDVDHRGQVDDAGGGEDAVLAVVVEALDVGAVAAGGRGGAGGGELEPAGIEHVVAVGVGPLVGGVVRVVEQQARLGAGDLAVAVVGDEVGIGREVGVALEHGEHGGGVQVVRRVEREAGDVGAGDPGAELQGQEGLDGGVGAAGIQQAEEGEVLAHAAGADAGLGAEVAAEVGQVDGAAVGGEVGDLVPVAVVQIGAGGVVLREDAGERVAQVGRAGGREPGVGGDAGVIGVEVAGQGVLVAADGVEQAPELVGLGALGPVGPGRVGGDAAGGLVLALLVDGLEQGVEAVGGDGTGDVVGVGVGDLGQVAALADGGGRAPVALADGDVDGGEDGDERQRADDDDEGRAGARRAGGSDAGCCRGSHGSLPCVPGRPGVLRTVLPDSDRPSAARCRGVRMPVCPRRDRSARGGAGGDSVACQTWSPGTAKTNW